MASRLIMRMARSGYLAFVSSRNQQQVIAHHYGFAALVFSGASLPHKTLSWTLGIILETHDRNRGTNRVAHEHRRGKPEVVYRTTSNGD